jgi:hypothetical protein
MADYKPDLPPDVKLPAGASINVEHADYKALTAVAREEGWSQSSFSKVLGLEVARSQRAPVASPTPAPAPVPAATVDFDKLPASQQFFHALANGPKGRR